MFGLPVINHVATADATAHLLVQVAEVTPSWVKFISTGTFSDWTQGQLELSLRTLLTSLGRNKILNMRLFLSSIEFIKKKISNLNYGFGSDPEVTLS